MGPSAVGPAHASTSANSGNAKGWRPPCPKVCFKLSGLCQPKVSHFQGLRTSALWSQTYILEITLEVRLSHFAKVWLEHEDCNSIRCIIKVTHLPNHDGSNVAEIRNLVNTKVPNRNHPWDSSNLLEDLEVAQFPGTKGCKWSGTFHVIFQIEAADTFNLLRKQWYSHEDSQWPLC